MSIAAELKQTIEAQKEAIAAKNVELNSFIEEKKNIQADIVTIEQKTLPSLRATKAQREKELAEAIALWKQNKDIAYRRAYDASWNESAAYKLSQSIDKWNDLKSSRLTALNNAKEEAHKWYNWYHSGCKWTGADSGFQGAYCGKFAAFCGKTSHNWNSLAPSSCLKGSVRKARNTHAQTQAGKTAVARTNAQNSYNVALKKPADVVTAEQNKAGAIAAYEKIKTQQQPMSGLSMAIQQLDNQIKAYMVSGGTISKLNQRIAFVDGKIADLTKQISDLDRERIANTVNYQKLLADEIAKQKIIDEKAAAEAAKREQTAKITEASISANLAAQDPSLILAKAKQTSDNKMYMLAGAALLIAGIYVIKNK